MSEHADVGAWGQLPFFRDDWPRIRELLKDDAREILPPAELRFAALKRTQPDDVHVVIIGQDPYPTPGHANGLAFSVAPSVPLPRSLANIFREMQDDIGAHPVSGDLTHWADQGVLLLNTALTVPSGDAGGHAKLGWAKLAQQVVEAATIRRCAFLLWGNHARSFAPHLEDSDNLIIQSAHPSPLSARRGFFGSRPFSQINAWLVKNHEPQIDWAG